MSRRERAEEALQHPNVRLFLDFIAEAEGASKGYNTLFGGAPIPDLSDHPNIRQDYYNSKTKKVSPTSAAGRYQFVHKSWEEQKKLMDLPDFSPHSQDLAAVGLMMFKKGALDDIKAGNFDAAIHKLGSTWASFPTSKVDQPKRSWEWTKQKLQALQQNPTRERDVAIATELSGQPASSQEWQGVPFSEPSIELGPHEGLPPEPQQPGSLGELVDGYMGVPQQTFPDALSDPYVLASIDSDANRARNEAVAAFTGNPAQQDIHLPRAIDASIRKLLVEL